MKLSIFRSLVAFFFIFTSSLGHADGETKTHVPAPMVKAGEESTPKPVVEYAQFIVTRTLDKNLIGLLHPSIPTIEPSNISATISVYLSPKMENQESEKENRQIIIYLYFIENKTRQLLGLFHYSKLVDAASQESIHFFAVGTEHTLMPKNFKISMNLLDESLTWGSVDDGALKQNCITIVEPGESSDWPIVNERSPVKENIFENGLRASLWLDVGPLGISASKHNEFKVISSVVLLTNNKNNEVVNQMVRYSSYRDGEDAKDHSNLAALGEGYKMSGNFHRMSGIFHSMLDESFNVEPSPTASMIFKSKQTEVPKIKDLTDENFFNFFDTQWELKEK